MKNNKNKTQINFSELEDELEDNLLRDCSEEQNKKLAFFWDHCNVDKKQFMISKRISSRVQSTISKEKSKSLSKKRYIQTFIGVAALAASVILAFLGVSKLTTEEPFSVLANKVAQADFWSNQTSLLLSDNNIITITDTSTIKFNTDGELILDGEKAATTAKAGVNTLYVPTGKRSRIELADGSNVWVNANSKLIFPSKFKNKQREVKLVGEAFFDVTKNQEAPFIVNMNESKVKVLGTSFNISSPKGAALESIVLLEGKVVIEDANHMDVVMKPNEKVELVNNKYHLKEQVDARQYVSWKDGFWLLKGDSLDKILDKLEDYYGCKLQYKSDLSEIKLYGKLLIGSDIESVLKSINQITPLNFNTINDEIYISKR